MSDVRKCLDAFKEVATSPRKQLDKVGDVLESLDKDN